MLFRSLSGIVPDIYILKNIAVVAVVVWKDAGPGLFQLKKAGPWWMKTFVFSAVIVALFVLTFALR